MRRRRISLPIVLVFAATATLSFLINTRINQTTAATDISKFDPGYIVSDYVMSNSSSMTEEEIQAFLKSKNKCNDSDFSKARVTIRTYHIENNHYVCMADDLFPDTYIEEPLGLQPKPTEGETAAHIIWQAAQDYQINPQALIVLLQKEQGLITDTWPTNIQYRAATGYGCPDTAPCSKEYYGFKNQVRKAASLFRTVLNGGWTNYPLGNNYIQYNPNAGCGGTVVNVRNLATSALYRYTPYQPNASALTSPYATGDSCAAYGNRNFYTYFSDWFGNPTQETVIVNGYSVPARIYEKYESNKDSLGLPIAEENHNDKMTWQKYENGYIVGNDELGYFVSAGEIRKVWQQTGLEYGSLGLPVAEENHNDKMTWQKYENGYIVGNDELGYFVSAGEIRKVWQQTGLEYGSLGLPVAEEQIEENRSWQEYENGCIIGKKEAEYYIANTKICKLWQEKDSLGLPIAEENHNDKMTWQKYENGYIVGNDELGYFVSAGEIRKVWQQTGLEYGSLGLPIAEENHNDKMTWQKYENGYIVGNDKLGYFVSAGEIRKVWQQTGLEYGSLGRPITGIVYDKDGVWQRYENGRIICKKNETSCSVN